MAAGSILSIGSRTRFWIMWIRREARVQALFRMGAHPDGAFLGVCIFIKSLPRYSRKAYVRCVLILHAWAAENSARHFHTPRSGAIKVFGHHHVLMARLVMGGRLKRDTHRIRRSQMRKRNAQARYLSPGFGDCEMVDLCLDR